MHTQKLKKPSGRGERHSAAWGKRLGITLVLATGMAFGQPLANQPVSNNSHIASELSGLLAKAKQGTSKGQTVKVIVQYRVGADRGSLCHHAKPGRTPAFEIAHD